MNTPYGYKREPGLHRNGYFIIAVSIFDDTHGDASWRCSVLHPCLSPFVILQENNDLGD